MADIAIRTALVLLRDTILLLSQEVWLHRNVNDAVKNVNGCLSTMYALLEDMDGTDGVSKVQKDRIRQLRDLAYDIEDALDEYMLLVPMNTHDHALTRFSHDLRHCISYRFALHQLSINIETIQGRIGSFLAFEDPRAKFANHTVHPSPPLNSSFSTIDNTLTSDLVDDDDEILGLDKPKEEIINKLINESQPGRKILAVVGSGGSGKSALAKLVYNDRRIQSTFDCRVWANANHPLDTLSKILRQLRMKRGAGISEEPSSSTSHNPGSQKYLIVLDNIWTKQGWVPIVSELPRGTAGSAVIVISRSTKVVESSNHIHFMEKLPNLISMQLFYKKAFRANNGNCPWELKELASQIVQRCEGIPLAIAAIGSLLSRMSSLPTAWKSVLDSLGAQIGIDSNLSIIAKTYIPSYNDLPSHLKSCFLYMAIFPEVKRGRLIRCWIAEGFIKESNGRTPEETAEDYLNDLIKRSLIQAVSLDFDGRLRTCGAANLVREFLVMKSEEHLFLTLFPVQKQARQRIKGCRRICFHNSCTLDMSENTDVDRVRTLFTFTPKIEYLPKLNKYFRLLKILDLQESGLSNFPDEIVALTLLRYLSLRSTRVRLVPASIKKLTYLETLDLKDTLVVRLPQEIFKLKKLRHLLVYHDHESGSAEFDSKIGFEVVTSSSSIGNLSDMQKLTLIKANTPADYIFEQEGSIVEELGKLVHLRKLGLIDLKQEDGMKLCSSIQNMTSLSTLDVRSRTKEEYLELHGLNAHPPVHLQRLYLNGRLSGVPIWINSLNSVVRIGLRHSRLAENPLDILQNLPNLIELQMTNAFLGGELTFINNKFKKLKRLVIKDFKHLHTMVVQQGGVSTLKSLRIHKCPQLKILPLGINYIRELEELILYDMPREFIARLEEDRPAVAHIPVIHSYTFDRYNSCYFYVDLSPKVYLA